MRRYRMDAVSERALRALLDDERWAGRRRVAEFDALRCVTRLASILVELEGLREAAGAIDRSDARTVAALERWLHLAAEVVFDLGHHLLAGRGRPVRERYRDVLPALVAVGVVDRDVAKALDGLAGLRNLLVNEYTRVEPQILWTVVDEHLPDLRRIEAAFLALPELRSPEGEGAR